MRRKSKKKKEKKEKWKRKEKKEKTEKTEKKERKKARKSAEWKKHTTRVWEHWEINILAELSTKSGHFVGLKYPISEQLRNVRKENLFLQLRGDGVPLGGSFGRHFFVLFLKSTTIYDVESWWYSLEFIIHSLIS